MSNVKLIALQAYSFNHYTKIRSILLKCCANIYFNSLKCILKNKRIVVLIPCIKIITSLCYPREVRSPLFEKPKIHGRTVVGRKLTTHAVKLERTIVVMGAARHTKKG